MRRTLLGACAAALALAGCGGGTAAPRRTIVVRRPPPVGATGATGTTARKPATTATRRAAPLPPRYPQLLPGALGSGISSSTPAIRWRGQTAAWISRLPSGVAIMTFDQRLLELHLHSGSTDAGTLGWRYGPSVGGFEATRLAAAFNGGFKLSTGAGGFFSYGRTGAPLQSGRASIVTYSDGSTDIGAWDRQVPAPGKRVVSVRQNLSLLVDQGAAAPNLGCLDCWGSTLGGVEAPARSGLGITRDGRLVWVAGESLTVGQLAGALLAAHAARAAELDINTEWVAGYFYGHRGGHGPLAPVPALPTQRGIPGQYLAPWSRDFFTIVAR